VRTRLKPDPGGSSDYSSNRGQVDDIQASWRCMFRELAFSFVLVAVCVLIHSSGLVVLFEWLVRHRGAMERRGWMVRYLRVLISAFFVIIILHLAETAIWAFFFFQRQLFSIVSYTTIGYGDVVLPQRWRLLGGIEGISGVLLCGLSTAFVFAVVNSVFQIRLEQHRVAQEASEVEPV
jgi:ion channel